MRGNTVNLTDPSGMFPGNQWDLFSRIGEFFANFIQNNEGARRILDALNICPDLLADAIRYITGEMDRIFNEVADYLAPYAETIAEIAVAAAVTHVVGAVAAVAGLGGLSAAIITGMAGRVAANVWAGRDWHYRVGDADAMIEDAIFGKLFGVDGYADDFGDAVVPMISHIIELDALRED